MNRNRRRNVHQVQGCLGRMVNLFDFGTVGSGKKLLDDKPYFDDDGFIKSKQFDEIEDKVVRNGLTVGVNGTPMKMLLAKEMSKDMELNLGSTNLVAKLMGLESFPHTQPDAIVPRSNNSKPRLKRSLSHGECKNVYEIWEKPVEGLKMDIVREKFLEAKRLVTDGKLRHSKEFQEAMEVLSSNKELFLEFLQESNNFFSHHLQSSTAPPTPEKSPKRITILKPSKSIESPVEKGIRLFKWPGEDEYNPTKQTSRIVVLKPNGHVGKASSCPASPRDGLPVDDYEEIKDVASRVKRQILKEDTSHSSVFSNGYVGDDSYYADSEIISPVSRHSWEYMNSPFSSSPFSRASGSPESSSVCREAKKRLSERWALMAASRQNLQEEAQVVEKKGGNISLGEMLALSDSKTDLRSDEEEEANDCNEGHDVRVYPSFLAGDSSREECLLKPFNSLMRSKSLPESSTSLGHRAIDTNKGASKGPEELTKSKSLKWSLKSKVSKFLFSRNKKASKERSSEETPECDASVSARSLVSQEAGLSIASFGNSSEWRDEPSPVSVLESSFDEDDGIFFNSSVLNRSSSSSLEPEMMMSMRSNLLGRSPSIGRSFSFDDSTVSRCYSSKRSTLSTREEEEEDSRLLVNALLSAADLDEESESLSSYLLSKWHSVESPLDPSLRGIYANSAEHQRPGTNVKQLVFDLVNTLLLELTPSYLGPRGLKILSGKTLGAYAINRMQECLKGNGRVVDRWWDEDGDLSSLAVNRVVRMEVAEIGSPESLRLEMDSMGEEVELKLLEELVEEFLMDFSEQSIFFISSIC